jgi:hypothetical protein
MVLWPFPSAPPWHAARGGSWPSVKPLVHKYHFDSMKEAKIRTEIQSEGGKPLYLLECYSFSTAPKTGEFMYSGDFECRLHSYDNKDYESTLLTELPEADADWQSRGRFLAEQLVAPCGEYKNLGSQRSFRLRGFKLEVNLRKIAFDTTRHSFSQKAPALKSFDVELVVAPDPMATSSIAATPTLPRLDSFPEPCQKAFSTLYLEQFRKRMATH